MLYASNKTKGMTKNMKYTFQERLVEALNRYRCRTAIKYGANIISYEELDYRSNLVASYIIDLKIRPGTFIALLIEDKIDFTIVVIGILKARCVIVPLDVSYPVKRTKTMLRVAEVEYIFIDEKQRDMFIEFQDLMQIITNKTFFKIREISSNDMPCMEYNPNDSIYVYFSSGTTGEPKAIIGKNKSLLHFIDWEIETFYINTDSHVSQFTTPCHDPWLRDTFVALFAGGMICIPENEEIILENSALANWIELSEISLIHCTPSLFRLLNSDAFKGNEFQKLKYILMAGERINPTVLLSWYNKFGDRIQLVNLYGSTETTMIKTYYLIKPADVKLTNIPVGKPMKDARLIILDKEMNTCVPGDQGEIYVQTPYGTHGYFKNSKLNSEKFIQNPFSSDPTDFIYKTGDIGKMLPDGNIEFLGRMDRQVKIRGIRVELGEIENVLIRHERIKDAVVTFRDLGDGDCVICAYVVENNNDTGKCQEDALEETLRYYLLECMPMYMCPSCIMKLDEIPLSKNKKIDYCALPKPDKELSKNIVEPRNEIEELIVEFCKEISGKDRIGIDENFIQIGGHSLNAMRLVSKIYKEIGVKVPLRKIFSNLSIEEIARYINELCEKNRAQIELDKISEDV